MEINGARSTALIAFMHFWLRASDKHWPRGRAWRGQRIPGFNTHYTYTHSAPNLDSSLMSALHFATGCSLWNTALRRSLIDVSLLSDFELEYVNVTWLPKKCKLVILSSTVLYDVVCLRWLPTLRCDLWSHTHTHSQRHITNA